MIFFQQAILVGAHYDSVPMCPGADDNGSAVAAMLGCAAACSLWRPHLPIIFIAFNCEEDGLRGSRDFVDQAHVACFSFPPLGQGLGNRVANPLERVRFAQEHLGPFGVVARHHVTLAVPAGQNHREARRQLAQGG